MTHLNRPEWDLLSLGTITYWSWCAPCLWHLIFLLFRFCGWGHFHGIFCHTDNVPSTQSLAVGAVNWVDIVTRECPFTPSLRECKRQIAPYDTSSNCQAMKWAHRASTRGSVKLGLMDAGSELMSYQCFFTTLMFSLIDEKLCYKMKLYLTIHLLCHLLCSNL